MKELTREELLQRQFEHEDSFVSATMQPSLDRIQSFLLEHTNLHYLTFISEDLLVRYIKHHRAQDYEMISFKQTIKDIKNFLYFLSNCKNLENVPALDLSVQNTSFWNQI